MNGKDTNQDLSRTIEEIAAWVSLDLSRKPRIVSRFGPIEKIGGLCRDYLSAFATRFDGPLYSAFAKKCESELFPNLFSMIRTEEAIPGTLEKIRSTRGPVIFLPNHDSNLDAMTHGIFFYVNRIPHPKITAGVNLCKGPDGETDTSVLRHLKGLNALVVDRKLLARDLIYLKVFREYFIKTLENGENHCFYIESGRSYGGEIKLGTTSAMLNWSLEARVDELLIVPVGVSYTRIYEDRDLVRCHDDGSKMPETNLLDEFARGARILGQNSPIFITTGRPVRFVKPNGPAGSDDCGSAEGSTVNTGNGAEGGSGVRLIPDPESRVLLDRAAVEMRAILMGFASGEPDAEHPGAHDGPHAGAQHISWEQKLHDFAYLGMLRHHKVLPHHVAAKAISRCLTADDTGDFISLDRVGVEGSALLASLEKMGANLLVAETDECLSQGLKRLESFGALSALGGGALRIELPGLCHFYGNKALHPDMRPIG